LVSAPGGIHAAPPRFPITLTDVAAAFAAQYPSLTISSLDVPAITASTPSPSLIVAAPQPAGAGIAEFRVSCEQQSVCLPFYVRVKAPEADHMTRLAPVTTHVENQIHTPSRPPAIRSGARAVLHIDNGLLHITLPVICLNGGPLGSDIRVTSLDRRMTYTARVVSAVSLKGTL
jgi:hypothetical protein